MCCSSNWQWIKTFHSAAPVVICSCTVHSINAPTKAPLQGFDRTQKLLPMDEMIQQWLMCGSMCAVYISVEHSLEPKGSPVVFDSIITGPAEKIIWAGIWTQNLCHTPGTVHDCCSHCVPLKVLLNVGGECPTGCCRGSVIYVDVESAKHRSETLMGEFLIMWAHRKLRKVGQTITIFVWSQ